jgi:hypothetical protein
MEEIRDRVLRLYRICGRVWAVCSSSEIIASTNTAMGFIDEIFKAYLDTLLSAPGIAGQARPRSFYPFFFLRLSQQFLLVTHWFLSVVPPGFVSSPAVPYLEVPLPQGCCIPVGLEDDKTERASSLSSQCKFFLMNNVLQAGDFSMPAQYDAVDPNVNSFDDLDFHPLVVKNMENDLKYQVRLTFRDEFDKTLTILTE